MTNLHELSVRPLLPLAAAVAAALLQPVALAQQEEEAQSEPSPTTIEEVVAVGRFISASQRLINERVSDASVIDALGADSISRLGDTTVAAALRRIPGLSLVDNKFVYVRGLGERYSASYLNGAQIPSPDLTRNVIPLDVFPTAVVESLRVQKAWSPEVPASFGGGSIDIRTQGVPDRFQAQFEISSGSNSQNQGRALSYAGGGDDSLGTDDGTRMLPPPIAAAANQFLGNFDPLNIRSVLQQSDPSATLDDAIAVNRALGASLYRDISIQEKRITPDFGMRGSFGNSHDFGSEGDWTFGYQAGASYDTEWRERTAVGRSFVFPDERTDTRRESTETVNIATTLNLGLGFTEDHEIATTSLFLRNTDDETAIRDFFNENREISSGSGFREYRLEFEERNMRTNQIRGTHYLGEATRDAFPGLTRGIGWLPADTRIEWFYSDSEAETSIPSRITVIADTQTDPLSGTVLSERVRLQNTAGDWRFTDLNDEVENYGVSFALPIEKGRSFVELRGGTTHSQKVRTYQQSQFTLGALSVADPGVLVGSLSEVFASDNIQNPANNFVFARQGTNNQSYLAATMTDSVFASADWTYNDTWRLAAGARWEDYRQTAVDWNPYGYSIASPQVTTDPDVLARGTFKSDEVYPAAAITYMSSLWAETFQLRFGWSETAVRPDLREITDASYIDPITDQLTRGNSGVVPSDVTNYDVRAEWFFQSGDLFSVTFFRKDLDQPIEFFEIPASDTTIAREIINADSAQVQGVEFEFLKELGFIGDFFDSMFIQGNLTLQDSELVAGPEAAQPTNEIRSLSGASEYVLNFMLGYDSRNDRHTASLVYNIFDERLYTAGRRGAPDAYEQPFGSLDMTYAWYPTDALIFKAKAQNILGETIRIERAGVQTFEEDPGTNFALSLQWNF